MDSDYDNGTTLIKPNQSIALSSSALEIQKKIDLQKSSDLQPPTCCFGLFSKKSSSKKSLKKPYGDPEMTEPWMKIFDDFMNRHSQQLQWVDSFLKQGQLYVINFSTIRKKLMKSREKTKKFQKDFEIASYNIYQQGHQEVKVTSDYYFKCEENDFSGDKSKREVSKESEDILRETQQKRLKNMINTNLREYQVKLYNEIEKQTLNKSHPAQMIVVEFKKVFVKQYQSFVSKEQYDDEQLLENIIKKTVGLQSEYVFKMATYFEKLEDGKLVAELQKKKEITLANSAIDDVKLLVSALYNFIQRLYHEHMESNDFKEIQEDIAKLIINLIVKDDVYRILICLQRIDNFNDDKDLRMKYMMLKGIKTTDFGIDPYLSLADPIVVIKEASKKYGIDDITTMEQLQNPTIQKFDLEDIVNMEFKEFFRNNKHKLDSLPSEVTRQIYQKAKIRPFQKSVLKFREIMIKPYSPMEKLFFIQELKEQIQQDIQDFWGDLINDESKLILNRDEQTSILLFIISKAEIPDLVSQVKLMTEFTSGDIQDSADGFYISDTFTLIYTTVKWISSLDKEKLEDKSYLLKANVQIKEDQMNCRYDKIKIKEGSDRFDPFSMAGSEIVRNSYINEKDGLNSLLKDKQLY